jgi:hypothetical protein
VLTSAVASNDLVTVFGTFAGLPNTSYSAQFYFGDTPDSSGFGEGQNELSVQGPSNFTTEANGNATFTSTPYSQEATPGEFITSIVQDTSGNMSEFSNAIKISGASISGSVFNDANGNGKQDAGEKGIAKQLVYLDTNGNGIFDDNGEEPFAKTNSNGNFTIFGIKPGTYHLNLSVAPGFAQTTPNPKKPFYKLTVASLAHLSGNIFGEEKIVVAKKAAVAAPLAASSMFAATSDDKKSLLDLLS